MSATMLMAVPARNKQVSFIVAWGFCLLFYSAQYALRSAPGVMVVALTALGVSSLLGLYCYANSTFAILAGTSLGRLGPKYVIPTCIFITALGST